MTPRRRISPQARKRYRNIKDFFKRAIGGSSQTDMEINSSTPVNVTELKHKIVGLEQQLSEVSRTCRDFMYLESSRRETQSLIPSELKDCIRRDDLSTRMQSHDAETNIVSENRSRKPKRSNYTPKHKESINETQRMNNYDPNTKTNRSKHFDINPNLRMHKSQTVFENPRSASYTGSFHSLGEHREVRHSNPGYFGNQTEKRAHKTEKKNHIHERAEVHKEQVRRPELRNYRDHRDDIKHSKNRKSKRRTNELDQDFIADIIKRQYKPVQMFHRQKSSISQFSEPMCRDREFTLRESIREDNELCSCCCGGRHSPKHQRHSYESDTISVCDARLHSSKINPCFKYHRVHADAYNNSELYDLIPVKEKSSPKTRRKFAQDNLVNYNKYREVPPSPRTHRPRLNLQAQYYTGSENHINFIQHHNNNKNPRSSSKGFNNYDGPIENFGNRYSSQSLITKKNKHRQKVYCNPTQSNLVHEIGTTSSLKYPQHLDLEQNNVTVDNTFNNIHETVTDKTDRALFEIKDILQSFLQEIKKETSLSGKSDVSSKTTENNTNPQADASVKPNNCHSSNNYNAPQCSTAPSPYFIPHHPNPCCYPVVPMYSMNCMQNGYVMPKQSFTCGCATNADVITDKIEANNTGNETVATETNELIKEIYKFVAQSPTFSKKQHENHITEHKIKNSFENRDYTSRSAGNKISKHDAIIGTPECFSKSCEAVGSKIIPDAYYNETNNATVFSGSTATTSFVSELSNERLGKSKVSPNTKIGKLLRSFGLFKKKKKDPIEEASGNESTTEVEMMKKPPFRQEFTSYMMANQVYDRPPPVPHDYRHPYYPHGYQPPYNSAMQDLPPPPINYPYYDSRMRQHQSPRSGVPHYTGHPSAPPHSNAYDNFNQMQPQVPVCLKEIEVKSMGTQSERKISFFRKVKQKMQPPIEQTSSNGARTYATQTQESKPGLWKSLQAKAMENKKRPPLSYSLNAGQQKLANGNKFRNALLVKMFYRSNPFSPNNMLMQTLMEKN